ncbi:MAG: efflux RND transporter periplasmic adaptor subunit [Gemmatimonadaceae bacterium]|nr:efflux RND transporter periplasmic adaptor subunit [Gemmatimonadaceae bacterium]
MSKRKKWSILAGAGVLVVAIGGIAAAKGGDKATEVRIEPVERRDLVASVTASGQVQPRKKVDVSADITGRIVRLAVREGDQVNKGQFLLEIDPSNYIAEAERSAAAVASSQANLRQARTSLAQARRNYERMAELKRANPTLISDEQVEQLRTQVEVSEASAQASSHAVAQAAAALRDARSRLAKTTIVAPMTGQVTRLVVEEGETAIQGTLSRDAATLLTIADMSVLEVKVKVDETDVSTISLGDSAVVQIDAFVDTTFRGRVVEISNSSLRAPGGATPGSTDQAIDYEVTVELLNAPPTTRPDFSATAKIITETRNKALSIPIIALTVREDTTDRTADTVTTLGRAQPKVQVGKRDVEGVFVVGTDNKVTFRPVRVGIAGERYFEVLSGLRENEKIVGGTYQAIRDLKDGRTVREEVKKEEKKA